jgi:MbtH protein
VVIYPCKSVNHRDTENTEVAQRNPNQDTTKRSGASNNRPVILFDTWLNALQLSRKVMALNNDEREDNKIYKVVVNHEEQYSIWPADRENALGWNDAGKTGTKAECLDYIKEVWTDMRPLSLRKKMDEASKQN